MSPSIAAMASASTPSAANPNSTTGATSSSTTVGKNMFLQLLVAQLKNQDPLNPTDSTQFVSELAQFSQLEQVIAIRSDIENGVTHPAQSSTSGASSTTQTQS